MSEQTEIPDLKNQIDADFIRSLIHTLPVNQKEVFNLYAIDGYNHKEISKMLEIPEEPEK